MHDYWLTQFALGAIGWVYLALSVVALVLATWIPRARSAKVMSFLIMLGLVSVMPIRAYKSLLAEQAAAVEFKARYAKAKALFDERCKTAGENIYRTVDDVDGIFLINGRLTEIRRDDQFERYDPYGWEGGGEEYVKSFLPGYWRSCFDVGKECPPEKRAFEFVEVGDGKTGFRRYIAVNAMSGMQGPAIGVPTKLVSEFGLRRRSNYGVRWDDISTNADREAWIAGGRLTLIDLRTNETIAERTVFLLDPGLGEQGGARSPWAWARRYAKSCPSVNDHNFVFVRKVLKPRKGSQ